MNNKTKKKMYILLFLIIFLIVIISIFRNIDKIKWKADEKVEESSRFSFNFGEPINLESEYGDEGHVTTGTDSTADYGFISELYDDTSMWISDGNLVVETAHGHITYSRKWLTDGMAQYMPKPSFGYLDRFVLQDRIASADFTSVEYDDAVEYSKLMQGKGFAVDAVEDKNKREEYYKYMALSSDGMAFSVVYKEGNMKIKISK